MFKIIFVVYTESLLLVNNGKSKVLKMNIFLNKPVSPDYDIDLSKSKLFKSQLYLLWRTKT